MELITRAEAKEKGLKYYFTGKPCKHGHIDIRYVYGGCRSCRNRISISYSKRNREVINEQRRKRWNENNEEINKLRRERYQLIKDDINYKRRKENASKRQKVRRERRESYGRNRSTRCANAIKYHKLRRLRIPLWSETEEIRKFYKECPKGHHVDHIIPLLGDKVSGLHVLSNLQYLPAEENLAKRNKFEVE